MPAFADTTLAPRSVPLGRSYPTRVPELGAGQNKSDLQTTLALRLDPESMTDKARQTSRQPQEDRTWPALELVTNLELSACP
jgi:hypothetical protein